MPIVRMPLQAEHIEILQHSLAFAHDLQYSENAGLMLSNQGLHDLPAMLWNSLETTKKEMQNAIVRLPMQ